ncbi:hydrolase/acyltransferase [Trichosporon asahii var. asahii CBS 8904]|uniref:Hydrolase/acyltransferase n=2 Tax=Trichosporon asahii var. asahii TaxID=189963 RepID=K1VWE1_TRIAC|nr:hydrolase/acyltransferase [Trichosporon asahii var. asahii CBS 2479]EJT50230.1 hydrolase/acyltransferase [Trichosporon asahii var. asahii CBS 2479]EKD01128.1 hydrolase/acyltransferase [Trichosporon asahii var. asahii CBS 8904]
MPHDLSDYPTVILVHGLFSNGGHWWKTILALKDKGYGIDQINAVDIPLTSIEDDVAVVKRAIEATPGDVILVGHSYAGVVISYAGTDIKKVRGLVYIAAIVPDAGESVSDILAWDPAKCADAIKPTSQGLLYIPPNEYKHAMCQDATADEAFTFATSQKPPKQGLVTEKSGNKPAWKNQPCYYAVSKDDHLVSPATQYKLVQRMPTNKTIELLASHASMNSHPQEIADLILSAAKAAAASAK